MNSTPAASKARVSAARVEACANNGPGLASSRLMVGSETEDALANWRCNEHGADGLLNGKSPGQPSKLNDGQRQAIARMIESGPIPAIHGVVRWRLIDLAEWIFEEFRSPSPANVEPGAAGWAIATSRPASPPCPGCGCD